MSKKYMCAIWSPWHFWVVWYCSLSWPILSDIPATRNSWRQRLNGEFSTVKFRLLTVPECMQQCWLNNWACVHSIPRSSRLRQNLLHTFWFGNRTCKAFQAQKQPAQRCRCFQVYIRAKITPGTSVSELSKALELGWQTQMPTGPARRHK